MDKAPDAFRTIREVAEWLETPAHVLRFWESRFSQIKPVKRAGGRRYYRPEDMALLGGIKHLLHDQGMTIRGVQKILSDQGVRHVAGLSGATPGVTSDDAIDHLVSGKARATAVPPSRAAGDAAGGIPPLAQDVAKTKATGPATSAAARRLSPTGQNGLETGSPVKTDPVQTAQPEFTFAPPPLETDARDEDDGSAQNPPSTAKPETSAPKVAASSALASAAEASTHQLDPDTAANGKTEGRIATRDAPAVPDTPEPVDAAKVKAIATPAAKTPVSQVSESSPDDIPARALIASRLRAGSRIAPADLAQARVLASRLAALQARMAGQRPGGSSHP